MRLSGHYRFGFWSSLHNAARVERLGKRVGCLCGQAREKMMPSLLSHSVSCGAVKCFFFLSHVFVCPSYLLY